MTPEMARAIEDHRFTNRISSENEAIRRLIEAGLNAGVKPAPASSGSGAAGSGKPIARDKPASPRRKASEPKAAPARPTSKLDQIRALREQTVP